MDAEVLLQEEISRQLEDVQINVTAGANSTHICSSMAAEVSLAMVRDSLRQSAKAMRGWGRVVLIRRNLSFSA